MSSTPTLAQQTRVLLVLGRVSNLPTVWSNCLAAWLLGGGGPWLRFGLLCLGATLLYTGGMFLNDAFDVEFDRHHRAERPIISGQASLRSVWIGGTALLCLGWLAIVPLGRHAVLFAALLLLFIVVYNWIHKRTRLAPLLMAGCRFLLYLVSASAAQFGLSQPVIYFALALFCYIVGLSYFARVESTGAIVGRWPAVLLFVPVVVASAISVRHSMRFATTVLTQSLWLCWCLSNGLSRVKKFLSGGVAGLLAGIPFVDWLAVGCCVSPEMFAVFPVLFVCALVLQRIAPAT